MLNKRSNGKLTRLGVGVAGFAALLLVVVYGGAAIGAESLPENTSPPEIITSPIYTGQKAQAAPGTWKGEPKTFTYQWKRCTSEASCETITNGGASRIYYPVVADAGKYLKVVATATNSFGSVQAESAISSKVQSAWNWYRCSSASGPYIYEDSLCSKLSGTGSYRWDRGSFNGIPFEFSLSGPGNYYIEWSMSGIWFTISCETASGGGSAVNQLKYAEITLNNFALSGCHLNKPEGTKCKVGVEGVTFNPTLADKTPETTTKPQFTLEGVEGSFSLWECPGVEGKYSLAGSLTAEVANQSNGVPRLVVGNSEGWTLKAKGTFPVRMTGISSINSADGSAVKLDVGP